MTGIALLSRLLLSLVVIFSASAASVQAQETTFTCFSMIEGQADVPPAAPLLLNRCTGDTFVLRRSPKDPGGFAWAALSKAGSAAAEPQRPPLELKSSNVGKSGCFTYNSRSYCP